MPPETKNKFKIVRVRIVTVMMVMMMMMVVMMMWCYPTLLAAAYPAVYGQFQQALTQGATLLPTTQKEGEKGQKSTSSH